MRENGGRCQIYSDVEGRDPLPLLDSICRFYHSEAKFPAQLSEMSVDNESHSLMNISNLFEQQLAVSHLARNEFLLIVTDGTHGRNLVEYLYRERIFSPDRTGEPKSPGMYYVFPRRSKPSTVNHIANPRSWLPGGIPQALRRKLLESVVTLDVVTSENFMKATSVFLVEFYNGSQNAVALVNTLIDAMVQKRATCVLFIFDHQSVKSKDILAYLGTAVSALDSGNVQSVHLFINFEDNRLRGKYVKEICDDFESILREALQGRSDDEGSYRSMFRTISVPKDVILLEHLLGCKPNQLKVLISNIRNPNFKISDAAISGDTDYASEDDDNYNSDDDATVDNNGMDHILELLRTITTNKVKASVDKLEGDIDHLYNISNRFVKEDRSKEISNLIASFQAQFQYLQDCVLLVILTVAIFLHLLSFMDLDAIHPGTGEATSRIHGWIMILTHKYTFKHWVMFYMTLIVYYVVMKLLCAKCSSTEEFDREKYHKHKKALSYLSTSKLGVNQLRTSLLQSKRGDPTQPRHRIINRRITT